MSTHYTGSPREELVLDTWIKYSRAMNTLNTIMRHNVEKQDLTLSQFGVMETLLHLGPMLVKDIGQKLLLSPSNLVTVIDNLVKQGLVFRKPCESDRRSIYIHLTPQGKDRIVPVFKAHLEQLMACFSDLDENQLSSLGALSKHLGLHQKT